MTKPKKTREPKTQPLSRKGLADDLYNLYFEWNMSKYPPWGKRADSAYSPKTLDAAIEKIFANNYIEEIKKEVKFRDYFFFNYFKKIVDHNRALDYIIEKKWGIENDGIELINMRVVRWKKEVPVYKLISFIELLSDNNFFIEKPDRNDKRNILTASFGLGDHTSSIKKHRKYNCPGFNFTPTP